MIQVLVFVSLVTVIAVYWWRRSSPQKKPLAAPVARQDMRSRYHCVEVCAGNPACESVLPTWTYPFPLPGGTQPACIRLQRIKLHVQLHSPR